MAPEDIVCLLDFLTVSLAPQGARLVLRLSNPNRPLALGHLDSQEACRVGPHLDYSGSYLSMRLFLSSQVATRQKIARDHLSIAWPTLMETVLGILHLGFPLRRVEQTLATFSGPRVAALVDAARSW